MINPEHYFPGQETGEKVFLFIRKYWLTLLGEIFLGLFLALLPMAILVALSASGTEVLTGAGRNFTVITLSIYYLSLVTWAFIQWLKYYLDVAMVTNERLVDVDQKALFKRSIAELNLSAVQDVTGRRTGPLETLFDFGDVVIQTAGERTNFLFHAIPHPHQVAQTIIDLQENSMKKETAAPASEKPVAPEARPSAPAAHPLFESTRKPEPAAAEPEERAERQWDKGVPVPPEETTPSMRPPARPEPVPVASSRPTVPDQPAPPEPEPSEYQPVPREYEG